jgi:RimJ/RimL family protein N-acetyltransferase
MKPIIRLSELTEDWKYVTRRDGFMSSMSLVLTDIVRLPYRHLRFYILARSLLEPFSDYQPKANLQIRPFEESDLEYVRQIDRPSEAMLCARRLAQGQKGLVAFCDGQPVGYAWGSTDTHTRLERVHPKLCPGDVLCTDSYTSPLFRGVGIQTALTLARFYLFRELGFNRVISYIEVSNTPSLAVWQRKFTSQSIGTIDFKRIGPWYRVRYF